MPNYHTKLEDPLTDQDFLKGMEQGHFVQTPEHKGFIALLHYSGVRVSEGLKATREQFSIEHDTLYFDVGTRLKHSHKTEPLPLPLDAPYVDTILESVKHAKENQRVWAYCRATGYNIVHRVFHYPHYHRLSRITWFFLPHPEIGKPNGFSIAEVRSWTGLSLRALDFYVGRAALQTMGKGLSGKA